MWGWRKKVEGRETRVKRERKKGVSESGYLKLRKGGGGTN